MNRQLPVQTSYLSVPASRADDVIDVDNLIAATRRQAKVIAACVLLGLALGTAYLLATPATYTAATRILLDDSLVRFATDEQQQPQNGQQADAMVLSQVEILRSSKLARSVVLKEGLQNNAAFLNPPLSPLDSLKDAIKAVNPFAPTDENSEPARIGKAAARLQSELTAERVGRSFVVELYYENADPVLAGSITRAYADAYLAEHVDANFDAAESATVWLRERLDELRESSQKASLEVEDFRAKNGLTAARGELVSEQQLSDLNSQLILAQADTANASARYGQFKAIVDSGPENAVQNATIPAEKGVNGKNTDAINELKGRYLAILRREQDIAARFGDDHPQVVALRREEGELTRQIYGELQRLTESYRNEFEVAKAREDSLRKNVNALTGERSQLSGPQVKLRDLEQKASALSALYQAFLARYEQASQQRSFPIAEARVISRADDPNQPSGPRKKMTLGLSLVLGLMAGGAVGALREMRERAFRTAEEVRDDLGLDFLGYLPAVGKRSSNAGAKGSGKGSATQSDRPNGARLLRVSVNSPLSSLAETLRNARLAIDQSLQQTSSRVIGVVSVLPREGKTTTAANLAGLLAASGARTLLIDGDLRNPGLTRAFALSDGKGLIEIITGKARWQEACAIDRKTRLVIVPVAGEDRITYTSELIASQGMADFLNVARKDFDYVIIDLPPLGPVVDAKAFAPLADGFVFVVEWGVTLRSLVRSALNAERNIRSKTLGVILSKTDMRKLAAYRAKNSSEYYLGSYCGYYVEPFQPDDRKQTTEPEKAA